MLIALILFIVGIVLIFSNPILGLIPGILFIMIALVVFVLALLGKGIGAVAGIGSTKTWPGLSLEDPVRRGGLRALRLSLPGAVGLRDLALPVVRSRATTLSADEDNDHAEDQAGDRQYDQRVGPLRVHRSFDRWRIRQSLDRLRAGEQPSLQAEPEVRGDDAVPAAKLECESA
jgi:hypothetical protein